MPNASNLYFPPPNYNSTNLLDYWTYIDNNLTSGWFSLLILIMIFAVTYIATSRYRHEEAIAVASFITFLSAALMSVAQLVTPLYMVYPFLLFLVSLYMLHRSGY